MNNGHLAESLAGTVTLEDVDVNAFQALCEYAYTQDYSQTIDAVETEFEMSSEPPSAGPSAKGRLPRQAIGPGITEPSI